MYVLKRFHTYVSSTIFRDKLDELAGEIERLEDTFEFSPLEDIDTILSRVSQSLDESLSDVSASNEPETPTVITEEQLKSSLW